MVGWAKRSLPTSHDGRANTQRPAVYRQITIAFFLSQKVQLLKPMMTEIDRIQRLRGAR